MISEIYKQMRFNAGREAGKEAGRQAERKRIKEILEQDGVELPPDLKELLFGKPKEKRS